MNQHEQIKQVLLETMDEFHGFCERHNLTYYLVGGGLIGAIRHKGLIPWDDDLDVIMPKDDYKKLLSLSSEFKMPLRLDNYELNKNYFRACSALVNNKLIVDTGGYENNITGVSLDVLCLYPTFNNKILISFHFKIVKCLRLLLILKGKVYLRDNYSKVIYSALNVVTFLLKPIPKKIFIRLLNIFENIKFQESHNYANLHGAWGDKEIASTNMLAERELYDFDGRQYWSMSFVHADAWLTNVYGGYMELPPESERIYRHINKVIKNNESYD